MGHEGINGTISADNQRNLKLAISLIKSIEGFKDIKINTVVRKGVNEKSILGLVDYCRSEGHILRFIEYMDVGTLNSWDIKNVVSYLTL